MAATVPAAPPRILNSRAACLADMLVLLDALPIVATLLADRTAEAATAATVGRLMAAGRLVAMAATQLTVVAAQAVTAATRSEEGASAVAVAATAATGAEWMRSWSAAAAEGAGRDSG